MIRAAKNDTVKVSYTGTLTDGTLFDQTTDERPLTFIIGRQEVIAGFDEAVEGMYQGESKTVNIPYDKAYGESKQELIETIDRSLISDDVELQAGGQLEITNHDDSKFAVMVREVTESQVTLDANHPLAGQELVFNIELLEVTKAEEKPQA